MGQIKEDEKDEDFAPNKLPFSKKAFDTISAQPLLPIHKISWKTFRTLELNFVAKRRLWK